MRVSLAIAAACLLPACEGVPLNEGLEEPIRVENAQFVEGELPGTPPLTAAEIRDGVEPSGPRVLSFSYKGATFSQQETGIEVSGVASPDVHTVGIKVDGQGSGYWVVPVGLRDPGQPLIDGEFPFSWSARFDLGASIEPGRGSVLAAGLDGAGQSGTQADQRYCVLPSVPDNGNACDPTIEPPTLVVSLAWESAADLDLRVVEPGDVVLGSDSPNGEGEGEGRFTGDVNANCDAGGVVRENVVWQTKPRAGTYLVYANLHSTCGTQAAPFTVTTHASERDGDEFHQVETFRTSGNFVQVQANGGRSLGLFVTEFDVN